jgi:hypothetical protein
MAKRKAEAYHRTIFSAQTSMREAAEEYGYEVVAPEPFAVSDPVGNIAPFSPFAYAALMIPLNEVSPPVESRDAFYVFRVIERTEIDNELFAQKIPEITEELRQEKAQTYVAYWYERLKEDADIEDYRQSF